jgi:VanZ family protein
MDLVVVFALACLLAAAVLSARDKAWAFTLLSAGVFLAVLADHPHLHL